MGIQGLQPFILRTSVSAWRAVAFIVRGHEPDGKIGFVSLPNDVFYLTAKRSHLIAVAYQEEELDTSQ